MIGLATVTSSDDFPGFREGEDAVCVGQTELPMRLHCLAAPRVTKANEIHWCFREGKRTKGLKHKPAKLSSGIRELLLFPQRVL